MIKKLLFSFALVFCVGAISAQNVRDVRINEIMVFNENSLVDDYGNHEGWIELYNTSHSVINIAGCYLTVADGNKTLTYRIPTNDHRTEIGPMDYMIFYAEGTPTKSTFHTNFTLDKTGYLAFKNASDELIDEITYKVSEQKPDVSLGRITVDEELVLAQFALPTPKTTNEKVAEKAQYEIFFERDPSGAVLAITAMSVVFSALLMLFLSFKLMGIIMLYFANSKKEKKTAGTLVAEASVLKGTDEHIAAIALAIKLYQEDLHDKESTVLTINRVARTYSPWSSKIYGINQLPNKSK